MLIAVQILLQVVDVIDHSKFGHRFVSNISQKTPLIQWQSIKAPAQNINHPIKFIVPSHFLPFLLCNQLETVGMIKFRIYYNLACGTMADDWECLTLCSITNLKYYHWSNTFPGAQISRPCHEMESPVIGKMIIMMIITVRIIVGMNRDLGESQ